MAAKAKAKSKAKAKPRKKREPTKMPEPVVNASHQEELEALKVSGSAADSGKAPQELPFTEVHEIEVAGVRSFRRMTDAEYKRYKRSKRAKVKPADLDSQPPSL